MLRLWGLPCARGNPRSREGCSSERASAQDARLCALLNTAETPPAQPPPRGSEGRLRAASAALFGSAPSAKTGPPPPPGISPACKMLSGFVSVKDGDNYKLLKPHGVSCPSFSDCKPPRSARRCVHSPLCSPPQKLGGRAGCCRRGRRQVTRPGRLARQRGELPPAFPLGLT